MKFAFGERSHGLLGLASTDCRLDFIRAFILALALFYVPACASQEGQSDAPQKYFGFRYENYGDLEYCALASRPGSAVAAAIAVRPQSGEVGFWEIPESRLSNPIRLSVKSAVMERFQESIIVYPSSLRVKDVLPVVEPFFGYQYIDPGNVESFEKGFVNNSNYSLIYNLNDETFCNDVVIPSNSIPRYSNTRCYLNNNVCLIGRASDEGVVSVHPCSNESEIIGSLRGPDQFELIDYAFGEKGVSAILGKARADSSMRMLHRYEEIIYCYAEYVDGFQICTSGWTDTGTPKSSIFGMTSDELMIREGDRSLVFAIPEMKIKSKISECSDGAFICKIYGNDTGWPQILKESSSKEFKLACMGRGE